MSNGDLAAVNYTLGKLVEAVKINTEKVDNLDQKVDKLSAWKSRMEGKVSAYAAIIGFIAGLSGMFIGRSFF